MTTLLRHDASYNALAGARAVDDDVVDVCERKESAVSFMRTRVVTEAEYCTAHAKTGSVYFIRNQAADTIKIGHSRDVYQRLSTLQVANSAKLELIGVIAAEIAIEGIIHFQLMEGHITGEWFWDRGVTTEWLMKITQGEPIRRNIWDFVEGRRWLGTPDGVKHYWNEITKQWEPPLT